MMIFYKVFDTEDQEEYYFDNLNDAQEMVLSWEQEIMFECFNYSLLDEVKGEKCNIERVLPWSDEYGVVCATCEDRAWCRTLHNNLEYIKKVYKPCYICLTKCFTEEWK